MYHRLKRLIGESSVYVFGNIIQRSFSIITMPVFTRYMDANQYGTLAIIRTVRDLMSVLYEMGTVASSTRFYYECTNFDAEKKLFSTLFLFTSVSGIFISIFLFLYGDPVWSLVSKEIPYYPYIPLTVSTVFLGTVGILPRTLFRVKGQAGLFVKLNLLQTLLIVVTGIILVVRFDMGALGPVIGTCAVSFLFLFIYLFFMRTHVFLAFSWRIAKESLKFGLPETPIRFGNWVLKMANQLILQYYVPLNIVAIYSVGYSVGSILFELIISGVQWAILPFYYQTAHEESEEKTKEIFSYVATYNFTVILFLALITIFMGKELLLLFASSKYRSAEPLIAIIGISCVFQSLFFIPSRGFYIVKRTGFLPPLLFVTVGVNVFLCFSLIPAYGIKGAAWATLGAYLVRSILTFIFSQRVYRISYQYTRITKALIVFLLILIVGKALPELSFFLSVPIKIAVLFLYPCALYLFGYFENREIKKMQSQTALAFSNFLTKFNSKKTVV